MEVNRMRRLIDPIELKRSIVVSNILKDGKTLEELIDEQPDVQTNTESIQEWQRDFREYVEQLDLLRDDYRGIMEYINEVSSLYNSCTDAISRRAAVDALANYIHNVDKVYSTGELSADDCKDAAHSILKDLPSAQPQRMRGRWIDAHRYGWSGAYWFIKCGNCGYERRDDNHDLDVEYKFCPNCGADMRGE